jgi:SET domain-containing protein
MGKPKGAISFSIEKKIQMVEKYNQQKKIDKLLSKRHFALKNGVAPKTFGKWVKQDPKKLKKKKKEYTHIKYNTSKEKKPTLVRYSKCKCKKTCGRVCYNKNKRVECTKNNCNVGEGCSNRVIQQKKEKKIIIKETPGKGKGAFANERIKKGDFIIEFVGEIIDEEMKELRKIRQNDIYIMELKKHWYLDAANKGNFSRFFNHSCFPSTYALRWQVNNEPRIALFAMRDIQDGEELSLNYGKDYSLKCKCGFCANN